MSTAGTIERQDERRKRRIAFLLAVVLLVFSVLIGWSRLAGNEPEAQVLGEVLAGRGNSGQGQDSNGNSIPGQGQANNPGNGQPAPPGDNPRSFGISGNLDEIYPTFNDTLRVTFTNPHRFEIVVTELDVELLAPSGECAEKLPGGVFAIDDDLSGSGVPVSKKRGNTDGTGAVDIDFYVSNDLPNECQNERFELDYTGTAIRANQQ